MWLRKKTQNPPTSCTRCILNPHDMKKKKKIHMINYVDSIYRIYKRSLRAPTKENVLVLIVVDIGGKNTEE